MQFHMDVTDVSALIAKIVVSEMASRVYVMKQLCCVVYERCDVINFCAGLGLDKALV